MKSLNPLTLVTGAMGSGKTLYTITSIEAIRKASGRAVYYHGINELALDWQLLESPQDWYKTPPNSIIVVDEAQKLLFPPRPVGSSAPVHVSECNTLRHSGHSLVIISQHPMLLDSAIRRIVNVHYHVVRFFGFEKSTIHEFHQVRENCDKSLKNSISSHFVYPKEVFNWYKSAESHTIKKRIPMRLVMIVLLPILLGFVVYGIFWSIGRLHDRTTGSLPVSASASGSGSASSSGSSSSVPLSALQFQQSFKPRLQGLAYTAPRYDAVTKPTVAPYPKACVSSASHCVCISQQGTRLSVSDAVCRSIAENGFFVDFEKPKDDMPEARHYREAGGAIQAGSDSKLPLPQPNI